MARQEGIEWGFFFDSVHIVSVNYARQEVRLYENGGSGKNRLLFKKDEPVTKIGLDDPFQLMNLAIHFVVNYDFTSSLTGRFCSFIQQEPWRLHQYSIGGARLHRHDAKVLP